MTDHSDLIERLREPCIDWTGEPIVDGSTPRTEVHCGLLREAASALSSQSLSLSEAMERGAGWAVSFAKKCEEHQEALREIERLRDFGGDAVDLAGRILENLGIGQDASKEPAADRRRDRIAAMIQRSFDAAPRDEALEALRTAERLNAAAKRGKVDGRVFIDYRDWEAFMAEARSALENGPAGLADANTNPSSPHCGKGVAAGQAVSEGDRGHSAPVTSGAEVAVKPLVWMSHAWGGEADGGRYRIEDNGTNWTDDRYWLFVDVGLLTNHRSKYDTLEAAKSAAQSDFETRIRSALVSGSREDGADA